MEDHCDMDNPTNTGYSSLPDNTTSDPTATSTPDCLYGQQVIGVIMRKPEFSFLIRYYNLLYQSLIPNCKLTIKILKHRLEIPSDVESFIVNGESSRIRCQRIINLLLVQLDTTRDYKHFCYLFNMISVMTDLPDKPETDVTHKTYPSRLVTTSQLDNYAVDNIIIQCVDDGPSDDRADNYSVSSHHQIVGRRRCRPVTTATNHPVNMMRTIRILSSVDLSCLMNLSDWTILDEHFSLLCNCLPDDYQSTLVKLKRLPQLSNDDHQPLGTMISSSCEAQLVNEKIVTFLVVKLCYNGNSGSLVGLCDVMDNLLESDQSTGCVQQVRCAITRDLSSQKSPSTIPVDFSLRGPSDSLVVRSLSLKCTPQVVSTGSSVVVAQSLPTSDSVISCQIAKGVDSSSITTESAESALQLMRSKYDDIVQSLPSHFEKTLQVVQNH
ncbi:uncharacterized protein [Dysidea avara]|uniref:uncharacterized protein isoform X3 n=1 Tax=Dysidea avara TaxID=196820 RepID=UPI00331AFE9A